MENRKIRVSILNHRIEVDFIYPKSNNNSGIYNRVGIGDHRYRHILSKEEAVKLYRDLGLMLDIK